MKTIVCEQPGQFVMTDTAKPEAAAGHAIIRIRRIGICGTDLHAYRGRQPFFNYPRILGHELSGEVESINHNVSGIKVGDFVSIIPYLHCGKCMVCRNGTTNCCTELKVLGVHIDGGMREYISVPVHLLIETNSISLDQAAIVECLSIGAHAVRRAAIREGENVLVIGSGPIGLSVMKYAKLAGARVIAMDMNEARLKFCKTWASTDETILVGNETREDILKVTQNDLPTVVFDATGNVNSMEAAFEYAAHGGKLVFVGLVKSDIRFSDPDFHKKELTLMSSRNATREDFDTVINSIVSGNVDTDSFITHSSSFDTMIDEFEKWLDPQTGVIKAIVKL
jgi:2-desacetyl-2-hydroxyethyl bacteriochlorophyllide A dehydrogenase